jgi:hypothetical protein
MTSQDVETVQEPHPGTPIQKDGSRKKIYHRPSLIDWGSLFELTGGPTPDLQDGDFSGSGGD